ncbi:hypothetical protein T02_2725 [Trichinella nativa]|uniref:Uncharacterized protein n=1 Tax=Trichinella nativa TaxID=6335 RepID=A0A0V1L7D2_9BILA|nr:hypothetical protein T02_2725 [Trichinella nativa]
MCYKNTATRNNRFIDNKHVNGGSSEYTVILSVMYHCNVSGRFSSGLRSLKSSATFLSYP